MTAPANDDNDSRNGWTPRGRATAVLMGVLGGLMVLSHLGVPALPLTIGGAVVVIAAALTLPRMSAGVANEREDSTDG